MIKKAGLGKELCVTIVNKIGVLADISKILADHGINIEAVAGYSVNQEAEILLVTGDNLRAQDALKKKNYNSIKENEVIVLELEDAPGALKNVTTRLAAKEIDIKYAYGTTCPGGCPPRLILSTSDNEKAVVALKAK